MTWFRIDDAWWRGKKLRKISKRARVQTSARVAAAGVWALCGDWSADQLSDGFVPWEIVEEYDPSHAIARRLIDAGFWYEDKVDGETGVRFHDWPDWNPTRAEVDEKRAQTRARVQRFRERQKADPQAPVDESADPEPATTSVDTVDDTAGSGGGNALRDVSLTPPPTRPDPTRSSSGHVSRGASGTERAAGDRPLLGVLQGGNLAVVCRTHEGWAPDRIPPCRACADVRRVAEAADTSRGDVEAQRRAAFRAAVDACPDCDENGRLPDTRVCPCNAPYRRPASSAG